MKMPGRTEDYYQKAFTDEETYEKNRANFEKKKKQAQIDTVIRIAG